MDEPVSAQIVCARCRRSLAGGDTVCPRCGTAAGSLARSRWTESPVLIVCLMVFAALVLGLPLLWCSDRLSLPAKIFWTVFVLVETFLLCWAVWWAVSRAIAAWQQVLT